MSDSIRRVWEEQERLRRLADPFGDLRLQAEAFHQFGMGAATMDFLRQEEERRRLIAGIGNVEAMGVASTALEIERQRKLLEGPIEEARRMGLLDPTSEIRKSFATALEARDAYDRLFRLPGLDEIERLSRSAIDESRLAQEYLHGPDTIRAAMDQMQVPWLSIEKEIRSARAFADIVGIGRGLNSAAPYSAALVNALRPSLGDWRDEVTPSSELVIDPILRADFYYERGLDPALTDFTVPAFEESIRVGGLDDPEQGSIEHDGFERANLAFDQLRRFEVAMRRFIERVMRDVFGEDWMKRQLPPAMLDNWCDKREKALKAGEAEQPLIDYADFTDYRAIIERKDNWAKVFKPVFGRPEDVRESFQRLFPVRIATMHARIVTLDDELLLKVETRRVLKAIARAGC